MSGFVLADGEIAVGERVKIISIEGSFLKSYPGLERSQNGFECWFFSLCRYSYFVVIMAAKGVSHRATRRGVDC